MRWSASAIPPPACGEDALYVVLSTADEVEQGGIYTFYLIGEANTLPADARIPVPARNRKCPSRRRCM